MTSLFVKQCSLRGKMDKFSLVLLVEVKLPVIIHCFYILLDIISQHVYKVRGLLIYSN